MQKELQLIDRQLKNNGLIRIPDSTQKQEKSLFRALSMAVFYSHHYFLDIIQEIKLTLISNLGDKRNNPYPLIHQNPILKKYICQPELILDFWENPDLNCFHNDVLISASVTYAKTITVYSIDKDEYLHQMYISACKNPGKDRIMLAKVGKKYFAVLKTTLNQVFPFIKEVIFEIVNTLFVQDESKQRQDKIHFPNFDEGGKHHAKQHKKSLSDCGDITVQAQVSFEERKKEFDENSDRGFNANNSKMLERLEEQFFDSNYIKQGYNLETNYNDPSYNAQVPNYYNYPYQPYVMSNEQNFSYMEPISPIHNQRYTGRLKFFDQFGNYGFIVIDSLNTDIFVHYDDLFKAGLAKEKLLSLKNSCQLRFQFTYYQYEGKQQRKSKKAIDLKLIPNQ